MRWDALLKILAILVLVVSYAVVGSFAMTQAITMVPPAPASTVAVLIAAIVVLAIAVGAVVVRLSPR